MSYFVDTEDVEAIARDYLVGKGELEAFMEEIRGAATCDMVPITRCKNCRFWEHNEPEILSHGGFCHKKGDYRESDSFCHEAEKNGG